MPKEHILEITKSLLDKAGFSVDVSWVDGTVPRVSIQSSEDLSLLIGKQGAHLAALEHIVRLMAIKRMPGEAVDFVLDANDYRKGHMESLLAAAREKAEAVRATGKAESLAPMNAYERKIVHLELSSYTAITTESIGADPHRRIVIKPLSTVA